MEFSLVPSAEKPGVALPHFPTRMQAFIFRACEFFPFAKIGEILGTTEETISRAAAQMGIYREETSDIWLKRGYITIIKAMWHLLPYEQLLQLLDMTPSTFEMLLKEDDFLFVKLHEKPVCEPLKWAPLTPQQEKQTEKIKAVIDSVSLDGKRPFDFVYPKFDIKFHGKEKVKTRMIYLHSGLFQTAFDVDSETYCPDSLLESYQSLGINGVWTQGVLYSLLEYAWDPSISAGHEARLENLKKFTQRCAKYGIQVYLYINEPRFMNEAFFQKHPQLRGHRKSDDASSLCISTPEVKEYLTNAIETLCREIPLLGGFVTITRSENLTNCYSHVRPGECTCPRCKDRSMGEVIGDVITCFREGADRVNKDIKIFVWSWAWEKWSEDIINHLPKGVILMSQSEKGKRINKGGIPAIVHDYSMSNIGPAETALTEWTLARDKGMELAVKLQVNTTWEGSTVPALPVFPLVKQHLKNLEDQGVQHYMLSWTLGGIPSENLQYCAKYYYENVEIPEPSENLTKACSLFSEAFQEFPFDVTCAYYGPQNGGPSNPLYATPTGYEAAMTCFAYDDVETWRGKCSWREKLYPADVYENQFAKLCAKWEEGLTYIAAEPESQTKTMAYAGYCIYKSSLDQIRFYHAREKGDREGMRQAAKNELETAKKMLALMNTDPTIGYEAANHYYFSRFSILEKLLNCAHLIETL